MISKRTNILLLLGVVILVVAPLVFIHGQYGGTDDAVGLTFSDLEFGFIMARQTIVGADDRQWIATVANAETK